VRTSCRGFMPAITTSRTSAPGAQARQSVRRSGPTLTQVPLPSLKSLPKLSAIEIEAACPSRPYRRFFKVASAEFCKPFLVELGGSQPPALAPKPGVTLGPLARTSSLPLFGNRFASLPDTGGRHGRSGLGDGRHRQ